MTPPALGTQHPSLTAANSGGEDLETQEEKPLWRREAHRREEPCRRKSEEKPQRSGAGAERGLPRRLLSCMQFYQTPVQLRPQLLFCHGAELSCWDRGHLACRAENVHLLVLLRRGSRTLAQRVGLSKAVGEGDPKWPNGPADRALEDSQPPGASPAPQAQRATCYRAGDP